MYLPQSSDFDYAQPPSGTHFATCYRVIDLGTQKTDYQGQTKFQRKIMISWELSDELMEDGRPFTVSKRYTFSGSEKATLRHDLESWRGKKFTDADFGPGGFDIKNVLGKGCVITIVQNDKGERSYANVGGVGALPKGIQPKPLVNAPVYFSLERDRFDKSVLDGLSEGLQKIIKNSPECADVMVPAVSDPADYAGYDIGRDPLDDEIPF